MPLDYTLRNARTEDLPHVLAIYNHYVANSTATFDEQAMTLAELQARFALVQRLGFPFIVAESAGQLLGYAYVAQWKPKAAYRYTVENSIYLAPTATGNRVGTALMAELIERCRQAGIKEIIAVIVDHGGDASIRLHRAFGFEEAGRLDGVGFKFGVWLSTILMQKSLREK